MTDSAAQRPPLLLDPEHPYRLFFPLGLCLSWAGVSPWFRYALAMSDEYRSIFHSIVQIQGFLMSFAVGFLFTAIPRRTETAQPAPAEMLTCAVALCVTVAAAHFDVIVVSQLAWLLSMIVLLRFLMKRMGGGTTSRRPPGSFVWIPLGLLTGLLGAAVIAVFGMTGGQSFRLHEFGKVLLQQGMFLGLIFGLGSMVIPMLTHGKSVSDSQHARQGGGGRILHLLGAFTLMATAAAEAWGWQRVGYVVRGALALFVLITSTGILRPPSLPGAHRWCIWIAVWAIPLGYGLAAAWPDIEQVGLHTVFILGFALLTFSISCHVVAAHGGEKDRLATSPWQVVTFGGLLIAAWVARTLMYADFDRHWFWMGVAASAFLSAGVFWMLLFASVIRPARTRVG